MKPIRSLVAASAFAAACACQAKAPALAERVTGEDGWVAWQVPMADGAGVPCCVDWHRPHAAVAACDLDGNNWNISSNADHPRSGGAGDLDVYAHVTHRKVDKLRAFASDCAVRNAGEVRRLDAVTSSDSIALLTGLAAAPQRDGDDVALAAIALHADPSATPALERFCEPGHDRHLREQALFWLGQARGLDGARFVERVATSDADADLRANAVFALSESHGLDAYASIHAIARHDASEHVREQALFWMSQMGDARARDDIVAAIAEDASGKVREQAVFALSQLKRGDADAALIALVRGNYPREVKQQALFWLGESGSDAAMEFLDQVLNARTAKATNG